MSPRASAALPHAALRSVVLPTARPPAITATRITSLAAQQPEALLAIVRLPVAARAFARLPDSARWRELNARSPPRAATVRTTVLGNRRQTLAVLGYLAADASPFERLTLAARMLKEAAARSPASIALAAPGSSGAAARGALEALLAAALAHAFALPSFRARTRDERPLKRVLLLDADGLDVRYGAAVARGTNLARWLTALPPNILDARSYRAAIARLARTHRLSLRWLDERALRRAGAGAFLAVAGGNGEHGAGIAHLRYRPARRRGARPDIALIGKGILFDTGGVNLKTHRSMLDMHTDMAGSAVALATLIALSELRAPFAADAWLAITENRIGPQAYRPQEVVRAANGVTIQVIHTDAEGRMVLADTLALAGRTRPRLMMDFATLTGACVYSLTERMSGVFTNRPQLAATLVDAGRVSGERVWNFPNEPDYDADLDSKVADIQQCSVDGKGDHILATRFLSRFVPPGSGWVHVDLSSATRSGGLAHVATDVTGFGVRFALELILGQNVLAALGRRA
ncbi:MAG TPA: leucyl aminopeptidase family protein [Steroidobacteraceae bacterium]|nr:leucyl aminopeptidase family protein [Steroidobacteraceae bacterium]